MRINRSIIRVIGLLGDFKDKEIQNYVNQLIQSGYNQDMGPIKDEKPDTQSIQFLRDYFYPDFRNIMFLADSQKESLRYVNHASKTVSLGYGKDPHKIFYDLKVIKSEVYLFKGQIGMFCLSINPAIPDIDLASLSNILSTVRSFDTLTDTKKSWIQWISEEYLNGQKLRGENVIVDEYSGSKFKVYSVIDGDFENLNRSHLLYDLATTSRLGSGAGEGRDAPDPAYVAQIMENRISVFKNWEALCLFDSFCCVGTNQLESYGFLSWDYTYFRIYLYRLFFKYNLYRYNSMIHLKSDETVKYRDQFEEFLNKYNISHISFNFLGNELFSKTGEALELESEINTFRQRINNLSSALQEQRQAKTNLLLQAVTVLSGISSVGPIFDILKEVEAWLGWSDLLFYSVLSGLILIIAFLLLYYLIPEKVNKWFSRKSNTQ